MSSSVVTAACAYCGSKKSYPIQTAAGEHVLNCPSCFLKFRAVIRNGQVVQTKKLDEAQTS